MPKSRMHVTICLVVLYASNIVFLEGSTGHEGYSTKRKFLCYGYLNVVTILRRKKGLQQT